MGRPTFEGQRILVTGGTGFIGSHIVDRLAPGNEVVVLDDFSAGNPDWVDDRAEVIKSDIRDEAVVGEVVADVDVVFHEAANISVEQSVETPVASHGVNVGGTLNILEAARGSDARVVVASSAAIYGHPDRVPVREDDSKQPASPYGLEKLAVDHYARLYHELYGLETVALRYFNVYGPRQGGGAYSGVIDIFLEQARSGDPITVEGEGAQTRDFVHVEDVVDANVLAARDGTPGAAFNVGTGTETSILELAETIQAVVATDADIEHVEPRVGDVERSCASIANAEADFGYRPSVDLTDGLETVR